MQEKTPFPREFYNRPTLTVAKELLGKFLVRRISAEELLATCPAQNRESNSAKDNTTKQRDIILCGIITETEAYCGPNDLASHASRGRTPRTEVMFGPPGYAYVYLIYGMYHCLNIVTEREGYPAAVLIRAAQLQISNTKITPNHPEAGAMGRANYKQIPNPKFQELQTTNYSLQTILNGPGKLCRHFQIDRALNKEDLTVSKRIWIEDRGIKINPSQIKRAPRIGIDYAKEYKDKLWRFYIRKLD